MKRKSTRPWPALSSLMEPLIMVILGVLIGGLVVAMYLPIFKLGGGGRACAPGREEAQDHALQALQQRVVQAAGHAFAFRRLAQARLVTAPEAAQTVEESAAQQQSFQQQAQHQE
jgi:hypothetical protein